jgi:phage terminase small subunit
MENVEDVIPIQEPEEEQQYSYREKALRDFFVKEYLVDYDATAAAIRVGYGKSIAKEYGNRFMQEPYVLRKIQEEEVAVNPNGDDKEAAKKRIMAGLVREANYRGPGSSQAARVAALSKLAHLHEMEPKQKAAIEDPNEDSGRYYLLCLA